MVGATRYRLYRVAERAFKPVEIKFSVCLHVTDGWLDCAAASDHRAESACDTPPQARVVDLHAVNRDALVATVDDGDLRRGVTQDRRLLQRFRQRMTVVRNR